MANRCDRKNVSDVLELSARWQVLTVTRPNGRKDKYYCFTSSKGGESKLYRSLQEVTLRESKSASNELKESLGSPKKKARSPAKKSTFRGRSPARSKSPSRSKKSPSRGRSPARSKSPFRSKKSSSRGRSPARSKSPSRSKKSPSRGRSPARSKSPFRSKSPARQTTEETFAQMVFDERPEEEVLRFVDAKFDPNRPQYGHMSPRAAQIALGLKKTGKVRFVTYDDVIAHFMDRWTKATATPPGHMFPSTQEQKREQLAFHAMRILSSYSKMKKEGIRLTLWD